MAENTQKKQIQIKAPDDVLKGTYANFVRVNLTPEEFILDFTSLNPADGTGILTSRIFMNPAHVKRMIKVLDAVMKQYEKAHGAVESAEERKEIGFKTE